MAHIKFVSPSGWEFDRQIVVPVKIGSRGLIGNDRRDFLKTASHSFLPQIDNYKFASDEIPVHLIALGASEAYGPNRNGDAFKEATCKKYHDTFVKFAKFFRNHKNKPERGDPFYGHVKASAYNDDMRRVELLCALNATKAAADRNGGLVADTEVEKIARGEDFPVSMACVLDPTYPVLTRDQGYLSIAEIKTGMYVWTHKGRWRRVTGTNRRRYTGKAYTFECDEASKPLELTSDHPMLIDGNWIHVSHLAVGDCFTLAAAVSVLKSTKITKITVRDVTDVETYNFEVEEDESYSLGGFVSHNCRVPNDICSFCKHAARTRDEYCTSEKCAAGGCKSNLTRLVKVAGDLHHLHVDNPDPTWFDISRVFRPADRIAYGAKADYFTKAASDSGVFELQDYIKLASTSTAPLDVILYQSGQHGFWSEKTASQIRLGYALASMEGAANVPDSLLVGILTKPFPVEKLAAFGSAACDSQLAAMADRCIFLSLADYSRLTKTEEHLKNAQAVLPAIYSKMASDETLPLRIERSPSAIIDKIATANANLLAASFSEDFSFSKESVYKRSLLGCCRNYQTPKICHYEKLAECNTEGEALAKDYAMYKLAALWRSAACNPNFPLTARLAVCQNQLFSV
jgi:hypothetical protein